MLRTSSQLSFCVRIDCLERLAALPAMHAARTIPFHAPRTTYACTPTPRLVARSTYAGIIQKCTSGDFAGTLGGTMKVSKKKPLRRAALQDDSLPGKLSLLSAGLSLPHPDKVSTGGEDAYMVQVCCNGGGSLAVADGVGGWNDKGVNPSAYSRCLVHFARLAVLDDAQQDDPSSSLLQAVVQIFKKSIFRNVGISACGAIAKAQSRAKVPGSATMVLAKLDSSNNTLDVCNIGDAGLRIIRKGKVVQSTTEQQYEFDMPYQMACPEFVDIQYNKAADGNVFKFKLQEDDWLVAGSDGLFDNMFDSEIEQLQSQASTKAAESGDEYFTVQVVARALAERSKRFSRDKLRRVPYSVAMAANLGDKKGLAKLLNPAIAIGGKPDDITVSSCMVDL